MTPGTVLTSARKAAGLSIADVAQQMRLSPRQVEALEADRYEALPGAVFVRGFIRNYARVLKLDPAPLLQALEPALDAEAEAPLRVRETSGTLPLAARRDHVRPLLVLFSVIVAAFLAAGGYELWDRQKEQTPTVVADGSRSQASPMAVVPREPLQQETPSAASSSAPAEPVEPQAPAAVERPLAAAASESASQPPAAGRTGRLHLRFSADSWLEVRDREGSVLFLGTAPAGTERTFEAASPLSVVIGNATAVRITYNGEPFDLSSHAPRNIARLTLQ